MSELALFITRNKTAVNLEEVIGSNVRVVGFGEYHNEKGAKEEVVRNIPVLKRMRFTHLGLEALTEDAQLDVNHYLETGEGEERIKDALWENMRHSCDSETSNSYFSIIEVAKKEQMAVVAVDYIIGRDKPTPVHRRGRGRDDLLADPLRQVLKTDPKAKIAALMGFAHVMIENHENTPPTTLQLLCREYPQALGIRVINGRYEPYDPIASTIAELGIQGEKFIFSFPNRLNTGRCRFNYIINVPVAQ